MPTENTWFYPGRIVYVRMYGTIIPADVDEQVHQLDRRAAEGTPPIHFLVDASEIERFSLSLWQARSLYPDQDSKVGWTVIYGTNRVTRYFASTILQLVKGHFAFFATQEEALAFLLRTDVTLQEFQAEPIRA